MADPVLYGYKILKSVSAASQTLDLTTLLDPSGSALGPALAGQFTAIHIFVASNADRSPAATGYTMVMDGWANDSNDTMLWAGYKFQPGTPDTGITITGASSSGSSLVAIATVWDNVDPTTPMDVSAVNNTAVNTAIPNPGSATPATTGAVFLFGAGNASTAGVTTLSESYMDWSVADSRNGSFDVSALVGYKTGGVASTPYDGAALTWSGTDDVAFSHASNVMVLRPTSGGGSQTITGAVYTDTDSFGAGTVSTAYTITGALYSDADTFGAGTFIFDQAITGAVYVDADTFGSGTFSLAGGSQTITGALYSDADTFGGGAFSAAYTVTGAAYSDPDSFGAGTFSSAYTITGALYSDADTFGAGAFVFDQTITGAAFGDPDTFGAGTFSDPDAVGIIQAGGWLPIKYVDREGREVSRTVAEKQIPETVEKQIAKAVENKPKAVIVSKRVLAALEQQVAPRRQDVAELRRVLSAFKEALAALNAAILAQELLDDEITVMLLAS